ncbi:hypothetical protein J2W97_002291 [Paenibacillus jamilae]|nr:hypothetical protein [Paenibacillus jamilae]
MDKCSVFLFYPQLNEYHFILDGSLSTGHANNIRDMVSRLETMVLGGAELPLGVVRQQISSAIDIFVHLSRLRDKSRRVLEISEVIGFENGEVRLNPLYRFQERGESKGQIVGELERCGVGLQHTLKLQMAGIKPESWHREGESV